MQLELRSFPPMRLAFMRHTGPYDDGGVNRTWQRFMAWCREAALVPPSKPTYGISQDNPQTTPPGQCRYDCAIEVGGAFEPPAGVGVQDFIGGRYACARVRATPATIGAQWGAMFMQWLPASGYAPAAGAALELYEADFAADPATGEFECLLCVPLQGK